MKFPRVRSWPAAQATGTPSMTTECPKPAPQSESPLPATSPALRIPPQRETYTPRTSVLKTSGKRPPEPETPVVAEDSAHRRPRGPCPAIESRDDLGTAWDEYLQIGTFRVTS